MSVIGGTPYVSTDAQGNQIPYSAGGLPNGVANGLTWTSSLNGTYIANIAVAGVSTNTSVQATIGVNPLYSANFLDAINCWLVSTYCSNGYIVFAVAGNPSQPSAFPIVWSVVDNYAT